ncbi:MAG: single-stranded-DNA-specific exonuclease RecJ [Anaerolineae bacterium]|nr:single-stranded-DNA-specific exonuclease RecJ [Anaerolineae bacterium]
MLTGAKRWRVADAVPDDHLARFPNLPPVIVQILSNRGLTTPEDVAAFLERRPELHDPFLMRDMDSAVTRLRQAIRAQEPIAVYGDFDADGVTATALLVLTLRALGGTVTPYIPHRVDEGYGLNKDALSELAADGIRLIVTVDCGVRSLEEVAHARQLGMDVIITDHHTVGTHLPDATAVLDPRRADCTYPYPHLAGVGLAFKLAQALLRVNGQVPTQKNVNLTEQDILDLVALGTVADLAPLTGENRTLVQMGLEHINAAPRAGVAALVHNAGSRNGVDEMTISYALAPRLNAAGRMGHAKTAYQLLTTEYPGEADQLAQRLGEMNRERQQLTVDVEERAHHIAQMEDHTCPLLFIADPAFPAGIVGLVASRLVEEFYRPTIIVELGEEESRGSARSIPPFHITEAIGTCEELLVRYGGHRAAAGFTVRTEHLPELKSRLQALATQTLHDQDLVPVLEADVEVPLDQMSWKLWKAMEALRPFGEGNPEPLFVSRNVSIRHHRAVGANGAHLKLYLFDGQSVWDGIAFRQGEWLDRLPEQVDIAYYLQRNEWNGESKLQLNIQDIQPSREY